MGKQVKSASFHSSLHNVETGTIGTILPSANKTFTNLKMETTEEGLLIQMGAAKNPSKIISMIVPYANIQKMDLVNSASDKKPE